MADTIRIKRRVTGAPGAPASLANAEIAYNEVDHILYYGEGTGGGGGTATVVVGIGGSGIASNAVPQMDGVGAAGVATQWARGDHIHPSGGASRVTISDTAPASPSNGDMWFDGISAQLYIRYNDANSSQWVVAVNDNTGVSSFNGRIGAVTLTSADVTTALTYTPYNATNPSGYQTAAQVLAVRLDQFAAPNVDVTWASHRITNLLDPSAAQDAATKGYVDGVVQGIDAKPSVRLATTTNLAAISGLLTIDGVVTVGGDRVLVKDQTTQSGNGIYIAAAGAWARALDADTWNEYPSAYVFVEQGTVNADNGFLCTVDAGGTLGTTAITWVQFSGAGQVVAGNGLTKTGNQIDVVGTAARISVAADSIDIDATYVGQASITTLGTVGTGTWNATTILVGKGGTGATTFTAGYLKASGTTAFTTVATLPNTDISGLGTMSTQNANAVVITGGTIDGITFDGGTF